MTSGTYSARFQSFCEHHLGLESGEPHFSEKPLYVCAHIPESGAVSVEPLDAEGGSPIGWGEAEKMSGLDFYERRLVQEFIQAYCCASSWSSACLKNELVDECRRAKKFQKDTPSGTEIALVFHIYTLTVETESPLTDQEKDLAELRAGFLIVGRAVETEAEEDGEKKEIQDAILYFRIRSSMRNMDLARKAFQAIKSNEKLNELKIRIVEELPSVPQELKSPSEKRAYREIHMMEQGSLDRCRWLSRLMEETAERPQGDG